MCWVRQHPSSMCAASPTPTSPVSRGLSGRIQHPPILGRVACSQLSSRGVAAQSNEISTGVSRPVLSELTEGLMQAGKQCRRHRLGPLEKPLPKATLEGAAPLQFSPSQGSNFSSGIRGERDSDLRLRWNRAQREMPKSLVFRRGRKRGLASVIHLHSSWESNLRDYCQRRFMGKFHDSKAKVGRNSGIPDHPPDLDRTPHH